MVGANRYLLGAVGALVRDVFGTAGTQSPARLSQDPSAAAWAVSWWATALPDGWVRSLPRLGREGATQKWSQPSLRVLTAAVRGQGVLVLAEKVNSQSKLLPSIIYLLVY